MRCNRSLKLLDSGIEPMIWNTSASRRSLASDGHPTLCMLTPNTVNTTNAGGR